MSTRRQCIPFPRWDLFKDYRCKPTSTRLTGYWQKEGHSQIGKKPNALIAPWTMMFVAVWLVGRQPGSNTALQISNSDKSPMRSLTSDYYREVLGMYLERPLHRLVQVP